MEILIIFLQISRLKALKNLTTLQLLKTAHHRDMIHVQTPRVFWVVHGLCLKENLVENLRRFYSFSLIFLDEKLKNQTTSQLLKSIQQNSRINPNIFWGLYVGDVKRET